MFPAAIAPRVFRMRDAFSLTRKVLGEGHRKRGTQPVGNVVWVGLFYRLLIGHFCFKLREYRGSSLGCVEMAMRSSVWIFLVWSACFCFSIAAHPIKDAKGDVVDDIPLLEARVL